MSKIVLLLIALLSAGGKPVEIEVEKIEINTLHDVFTQKFNRWEVPVIVPITRQIIVWEWDKEYGRYNVRDYFLINTASAIESKDGRNRWYSFPEDKHHEITKSGDYYHLVATMNGKKYLLKTKHLIFTECYTSEDPERENKKVFEEKHRNKIFNH